MTEYCDVGSWSCVLSPELCDNNVDDDFDGFTDEEDSDCPLTLSYVPNPTNRSAPITATTTGTGTLRSGDYTLCDYRGCTGTNSECFGVVDCVDARVGVFAPLL